MRIVSYLIILFGLAMVLGDAFAPSIVTATGHLGLGLMIFGVAGLIDVATREVKSLRE